MRSLEAEKVRYLIVGGLAVVAHGYVRFTADIDLIVDLEEKNIGGALRALVGLGYRPRAPVKAEEFADAGIRRRWIEEKGMTVFSMLSSSHQATEIDIFAEIPLDFEKAYSRRVVMGIAKGVTASFIGIDDLIALKEKAGRPKDLQDIEELKNARKDDA